MMHPTDLPDTLRDSFGRPVSRGHNVLELPFADALWNEANELTEDMRDLFRDQDIPTPEVVQGMTYAWTRESCADMRRALRLLRDAQMALEQVQHRERPRQAAFDQRLRMIRDLLLKGQ